jgi:hypothetical protein
MIGCAARAARREAESGGAAKPVAERSRPPAGRPAVKPTAGLPLVLRVGTQGRVRQVYIEGRHRADIQRRIGNLAATAKRRNSFLPPPRGSLLLVFANPLAVAYNDGNVGMMQETIEQGDDASGVREYLVPFLEGPVRGENDRLALGASVDDFIKQVGRLVSEG